MAWPDRMVLGILGRRADELALVWAFELARRWSAELHVVAGYNPPVGMFPHVVTEREHAAERRAARRRLTQRVEAVIEPGSIDPRSAELTVIPENQLEHDLMTRSREADLLLLSLAPTGVGLLVRRRRARARRITENARCPANLGPGGPIEPAVDPAPVREV